MHEVCHRHSDTVDGAAAAAAADRKFRTYSGTFSQASYNLWPLAVETYGRWGADAEVFFDALATHAAGGRTSSTWRTKGVIAHHIRQTLAVAVQRAVSQAVLSYDHRVQLLRRLAVAPGADAPIMPEFLH